MTERGGSALRELLQELVEGEPASPDWPALVLGNAARLRRRRMVAQGVGVLLVVALATAVGALVFTSGQTPAPGGVAAPSGRDDGAVTFRRVVSSTVRVGQPCPTPVDDPTVPIFACDVNGTVVYSLEAAGVTVADMRDSTITAVCRQPPTALTCPDVVGYAVTITFRDDALLRLSTQTQGGTARTAIVADGRVLAARVNTQPVSGTAEVQVLTRRRAERLRDLIRSNRPSEYPTPTAFPSTPPSERPTSSVNTPAGPPRVGKLYLTYLPTGYTAIPAAPTEHVVCSTRGCQSPSAVPTESTAGSVLLQGTRLPPIAINLGPGPYAPGARPEQVRIHGHPAVLSVDSGSGAIMLSWRYDRDTYAFVGMDGALTAERQAVVLRVAKGLLPHGASAGPTPTNRYCMYATPGTNMDDDACFATQTAVDAYARAVEY